MSETKRCFTSKRFFGGIVSTVFCVRKLNNFGCFFSFSPPKKRQDLSFFFAILPEIAVYLTFFAQISFQTQNLEIFLPC